MKVDDFCDMVDAAPSAAMVPLAAGIALQSVPQMRRHLSSLDLKRKAEAYETALRAVVTGHALGDFDADAVLIDPEKYPEAPFTVASALLVVHAYEGMFEGIDAAPRIREAIKNEIDAVAHVLVHPGALTTVEEIEIPPDVARHLHVHIPLLRSGEVPERYLERCSLESFAPL